MLLELGSFLLPGLISVVIYRILNREKIKIYSCLEYYAGFTFVIYFLSSSFMYFRGWTDYSISLIERKEQIKYWVVCFLFSILLPFLVQYGKTVKGWWINKKGNGTT